MNIISKLCILLALLVPTVGNAETLYVYSGTNGYAIAASRSDLNAYNLDTSGLLGREHPDYARWQIETGLPIPRIAPAVVDRDSGVVVAMQNGNVDAALSKLATVVSNHPEGQRKARIEGNRNSAAFTTMTNQLAQYDGHYSDLTNLIATANFANTNQMRNLLTKQRQAMDDCHDALLKVVQVLRRMMEDQK